ncbi:hypothetical protein C8Q76DRAFT_799185 [Earliella scabrosa]|nr:hypothetical protein C8Q76DRAFT_799185 [Earliella scabrosa]
MSSKELTPVETAIAQLDDSQQTILDEFALIEGEAIELRRVHLLHGPPTRWGKTIAARLTFKNNERCHTIRKHMERARARLETLWGAGQGASQVLVRWEEAMGKMSSACREVERVWSMVPNASVSVEDLLADEADILQGFQLWKPCVEVLCITELYDQALSVLAKEEVSQRTLQELSEAACTRFTAMFDERRSALDEVTAIVDTVRTKWSKTQKSQIAMTDLQSTMQTLQGMRDRINATKNGQDRVKVELEELGRQSPIVLTGRQGSVVPLQMFPKACENYETLLYRAAYTLDFAIKYKDTLISLAVHSDSTEIQTTWGNSTVAC